MKIEKRNKNSHTHFPDEVSEECFLNEALYYMAFDYAPISSFYQHVHGDDEEDARSSEYLYCAEIDVCDVCDDNLIHELISHKFQIEDPYFDPKYEDVNYKYSIKQENDFYERIFDAIKDNKEELEKFRIERELFVEYSDKRAIYEEKVNKILIPHRIELFNLLKSGKVEAYGFLVQKYNIEEEDFINIDEDWIDKAYTKKYDDIDCSFHAEFDSNEENKIYRVPIPKEYWKIENVDFEESSLVFNVSSEKFRYLFILIDFSQLHKIINNDLIYNSEVKISKNGITYKTDKYINLKEAEAIKDKKYINEKIKGGKNSYKRNHFIRKKVQEICKKELKTKKYSSASKLCNYVEKYIEENHQDLLSEFYPYQVYLKDGGFWTKGTFYNWCNDIFKQSK